MTDEQRGDKVDRFLQRAIAGLLGAYLGLFLAAAMAAFADVMGSWLLGYAVVAGAVLAVVYLLWQARHLP